ncbi:MAG: hypothetical protein ACKOPG_01870 [Novosphingobium sp.]
MHIDLTADAVMLSAARRPARRAPWIPLLSAVMELAGSKAELLRHAERSWASVTFSGTRHTVTLAFTGTEAVAAGESLIDALPDHEFAIPRQLVADAAVVAVDHTALPEPRLEVTVELLLLEDG